jgi:hypothetical protein
MPFGTTDNEMVLRVTSVRCDVCEEELDPVLPIDFMARLERMRGAKMVCLSADLNNAIMAEFRKLGWAEKDFCGKKMVVCRSCASKAT